MLSQFIDTLNAWGHDRTPFLFIIDFEMEKPVAFKIGEIDPQEILFQVSKFNNLPQGSPPSVSQSTQSTQSSNIEKFPIPYGEYQRKFNNVVKHLQSGDSFLTNLTFKTEVHLKQSLHQLFFVSKAKYKLWYKNEFLVFSPETFVQIRNGKIFSYPMKGTIDASLPDAPEKILNDKKELAEHITIVDLIRNDLSLVGTHVEVTRFRYLDRLKTNHKDLLQVSSEIAGNLPDDYYSRIGSILISLLPAGSICGAPKPKTIDIIRETEQEKRGYYTGIFGYFDGQILDSGVMIRYIEKEGSRHFYRSGGGITTQSVAQAEYQEVIDKIYVPIH
jgi:para-aminobenzoate synthetase component 1